LCVIVRRTARCAVVLAAGRGARREEASDAGAIFADDGDMHRFLKALRRPIQKFRLAAAPKAEAGARLSVGYEPISIQEV